MHAPAPAAPVALVTGSARRIGAAIARSLHAAGYAVVLHCRHSRSEGEALAATLDRERAGSVLLLQAELGDAAAPGRLVEQALARFGRLDALVNNASTFQPSPLDQATPAQWDALFAANARAPFFLAQAAAPHLRASGGAIVNLLDVYAAFPKPGYSLYSASKAALVALTTALAAELAPEVRVNGVAPGAIAWPESGSDPAAEAAILARTPLGRLGRAEEVAEVVLALLRFGYVTGQVLRVDGGRSTTI